VIALSPALIPPNTGPPDFQASGLDLQRYAKARLLVKNGLDMEPFLRQACELSRYSQLVGAFESRRRGVATIDSPQEHGTTARRTIKPRPAHGEVNPHIWLDRLRRCSRCGKQFGRVTKADPSCSEGLSRKAEAYTTLRVSN